MALFGWRATRQVTVPANFLGSSLFRRKPNLSTAAYSVGLSLSYSWLTTWIVAASLSATQGCAHWQAALPLGLV